MWFQLRSPGLAEDFERLMTGDRDIVCGSLDTVSDWRLTRPADVPGQAIGQAGCGQIFDGGELDRYGLCSSRREIELDDWDEPIRRHELYDARDVVPAAAQWSTTLWKFGISVGLCALRVSTVAHARTRATERCARWFFYGPDEPGLSER
jgi:hypothetical protein